MTTITFGRIALPRRSFAVSPLATLRLWQERRRARAELRHLLAAPHLIDDIGLRRETAEVEAAKPFWVE